MQGNIHEHHVRTSFFVVNGCVLTDDILLIWFVGLFVSVSRTAGAAGREGILGYF